MKDIKKKNNSSNIISWIFTFSFLPLVIAIIFDYINLNNPTIQISAMFIVEILLAVTFISVIWFDTIQQELYDIKNSLDDLYDLKQINDLRSTVNKRHLEKLLNDMEEKINEESKD